MPTPAPAQRRIAPTMAANVDHPVAWRCSQCSMLLGVHRSGQLHIKFARGAEYLVGYPATATCRGCNTLNRTSGPSR